MHCKAEREVKGEERRGRGGGGGEEGGGVGGREKVKQIARTPD